MSRTIPQQKSNFLRTQIRLLTAPLAPTPDWRDFAQEPEDGDIPDKVIEDVLHKLNTNAKNHHRAVYSSQAIRVVAEQIDTLYASSIYGDGLTIPEAAGPGVLERDTDFTLSTFIAQLPEEWPSEDSSATPPQPEQEALEQYQSLRTRILDLDSRRVREVERLARYNQLQQLVAPLKDPRVNVQPNLVTRDGELERELEKMRVLLARVTGKIVEAGRRGRLGEELDREMKDDEERAVSGDERLRMVLDEG